jgi:hypothetical protein
VSATGLLRRTAKAILSPEALFVLWAEAYLLRKKGPAFVARWNAMLTHAWIRDRLSRRRYRPLTEEQLRAARRSDTVFVFGCGSSLNELAEEEWELFREHDSLGFNAFFRQDWLPVGFHLFRVGVLESLRWRPYAELAGRSVAESPHYRDTIFLLQEGYMAQFSNQLVGHRLLPEGAPVFRYRTARGKGLPNRSLRDGVRHIAGTLDDAVSAAYAIGWKEIVLVGVDLYDSRYFWLPADKTSTSDPATGEAIAADVNTYRGLRAEDLHSTAQHGVVDLMADWAEHLAGEGVRLSVYNPRSLLASVLPVYPQPVRA